VRLHDADPCDAVLIGAILIGLILGLAAGGSIWNLANIKLERIAFLLGAVVLRFATEAFIANGVGIAESLRLPLYGGAYALLLAGLWPNRDFPGLSMAFVGILGNTIAIVANGGHMPIWQPSLEGAGLTLDDVRTAFHSVLPMTLDANFLIHAGPLGDVIPIPFPVVRNVASVGDLFLSAGLGFFLFATVVQTPEELDEIEMEAIERRLSGLAASARLPGAPTVFGETRVRAETGLSAGVAEAAALERPALFGSDVPGISAPALAPLPLELEMSAERAVAAPIPRPIPQLVERARRNPYAQLAVNGTFSALWTGQVISLFGDRVHQVALAFLVLGATNSPLATAAVFIAATLPNLLFSPIAGTFVDRWDHREVMIVSDLLRAAIVLLVPIAAITSLILVYPLTFLLTTISIFFRPARIAALPRIVPEEQLVTANSATWLAETLADIVGYPLAGLFVGFLGATTLGLAFWFDSATYIASAALIWTIVIPPVVRKAEEVAARAGVFTELRQGWAFLRGQTLLMANTAQAVVGQFTIGALIALTPVYARDAIAPSGFDVKAVYAFLETGIGVGNLIGGFVIGLIGARLARGRTVIVGYIGAGLSVALLGIANQLPLALGLMVGLGVANMVFVIPSQTLFQEKTPADLMGRVLGIRFALVFGSMTVAMGVGGVLGEFFGAPAVIGALGVVTLGAGVAGLFVPAVRDA
jgi:MFS transporter, DHA3 family, macrolide efflux protein